MRIQDFSSVLVICKAWIASGSCLSHNGKNDSLQLAISRTQKGWRISWLLLFWGTQDSGKVKQHHCEHRESPTDLNLQYELGVPQFNSILALLLGDSIRFYGFRAHSTGLPPPSFKYRTQVHVVFLTNWLQIGGSKDSPLWFN